MLLVKTDGEILHVPHTQVEITSLGTRMGREGECAMSTGLSFKLHWIELQLEEGAED